MKLKLITWQEVADRLGGRIKEGQLCFVECFVGAHLSYNFLVRNKRGNRVCSEADLRSLVNLLLADCEESCRHGGKWGRETKEQSKQFFAFLAALLEELGAKSLASYLEECMKKLF